MRHVRPILIVVLTLALLGWQGNGARATHDGTGVHIDQISIDVGPLGIANGVEGNGKPAAGDRDGDGVVDPEGAPDPGGGPSGLCDNGIDDDHDGGATAVPDGVADDGCRVPLTSRQTCIYIINDDLLNADEDQVDRVTVDITVGAQPGPGGGVPPSRPLASWQYSLNWNYDVLDVASYNLNFLILTSGGASPFVATDSGVPDATSPYTVSVSDAGPGDTGPGVLSRVSIEGNAPGPAGLTLSGVAMMDINGASIPVDVLNSASVAVTSDGPDPGTTIGDGPGEGYGCVYPYIGQVSVDVGPPGVANGVDGNGRPAVGDRNGDGFPDAEGYWIGPGDSPGNCGNGLDDDQIDTDGDTVPGPGGFDGSVDDGCWTILTTLETCAAIIDDGILNADEDQLVGAQDRASIDITAGAQPGPYGGVPDSRRMASWDLSLEWDLDVIDVDLINPFFLIAQKGVVSGFQAVWSPLPGNSSPFDATALDGLPGEDRAGVLTRLTIEGNAAGISHLSSARRTSGMSTPAI